MIKSLLVLTVALVAGIAIASEASARRPGLSFNGRNLNGVSENGRNLNGILLNGRNLNGGSLNGTAREGAVDARSVQATSVILKDGARVTLQ
jgi:hypothetical protein